VARELTISERTVEHHVENILDKLGLSSRTQLAAWVLSGEEAVDRGVLASGVATGRRTAR
jgi:hypothetical protein